jgi:SAGA-associated factor 73
MSAKRAVPGRSQPYDILLAQWQRKNQAKIATTQKPIQKEIEDVDSEEEVRLVMTGVMRRYSRPMEQKCIVGVKRRTRGMRMYEGLKVALLGAVHGITGSGIGRGRRQSQAAET